MSTNYITYTFIIIMFRMFCTALHARISVLNIWYLHINAKKHTQIQCLGVVQKCNTLYVCTAGSELHVYLTQCLHVNLSLQS